MSIKLDTVKGRDEQLQRLEKMADFLAERFEKCAGTGSYTPDVRAEAAQEAAIAYACVLDTQMKLRKF